MNVCLEVQVAALHMSRMELLCRNAMEVDKALVDWVLMPHGASVLCSE